MSILLETNLGGDIVIDLDLKGSPALCKNLLKLAKLRYYTSCLVYNVQSHRFFQTGDPTGTGQGGACIHGVLDSDKTSSSRKRFLKSTSGRRLTPSECRERGRVVAMELNHTKDTIGSQFLITLGKDRPGDALDGYLIGDEDSAPLSLGVVAEDDDGILDKIEASYCDTDGRPYADIRISRMLVLHDPFPDPPGFWEFLKGQPDILIENEQIIASPDRSRPPQETVPERIPVNELDPEVEETEEQIRQRKEKEASEEAHQRAVVLELLGDLPDAEYKAPEHVLFVCKLNAITQDEDLELIFSRFDPNCKAEIIRDQETGSSLQYAFVEFSNKQQCVEAYFKMNNALVDDRRIKVDFSQSVAKLWDKHTQRLKARSTNSRTPSHPAPSSTHASSLDLHRPNFGRHGGPQRLARSHRNGGARDEFGRSSRQPAGGPRQGYDSSHGDPRARHAIDADEKASRMKHERHPTREERTDILGGRAEGRSHRNDDDGVDRRRDRRGREHRKRDSVKDDEDNANVRPKKHKRSHHYARDSDDGSCEGRRGGDRDLGRRRRDYESPRRSRSPEDNSNRRHKHKKDHNNSDDSAGQHGREGRPRDDDVIDARHGRLERCDNDDDVEGKGHRLGSEGRNSDDDERRRRKHKRRSEESDERKRHKKEKGRHRDKSASEHSRRREERDSSDDGHRRFRDR
jgi:peptidyl-prolyl cis-trans isomerase-like 4